MYDIIGDIHGHSNTLETLLNELGYTKNYGFYSHKNRKVIFTGDFIDRGPNIIKTLEIVKAMVDNRSAYSIMGNHEYNSICYHTRDTKGDFLREHSDKNRHQYRHTLKEFYNHKDLLLFYINWFKTLPLFLEIDGIRIVHACWDYEMIAFVKNIWPTHRLTWDFLLKSADKTQKEYNAIDILLKGKEIHLPYNYVYTDKDGTKRKTIRIKWWKSLENETYQSIAINYSAQIPNILLKNDKIFNNLVYKEDDAPVFLGHYWRQGLPQTFTKNICSVDYSVAKNGKLVAYRWDGEKELDNSKFVSVNSSN